MFFSYPKIVLLVPEKLSLKFCECSSSMIGPTLTPYPPNSMMFKVFERHDIFPGDTQWNGILPAPQKARLLLPDKPFRS